MPRNHQGYGVLLDHIPQLSMMPILITAQLPRSLFFKSRLLPDPSYSAYDQLRLEFRLLSSRHNVIRGELKLQIVPPATIQLCALATRPPVVPRSLAKNCQLSYSSTSAISPVCAVWTPRVQNLACSARSRAADAQICVTGLILCTKLYLFRE